MWDTVKGSISLLCVIVNLLGDTLTLTIRQKEKEKKNSNATFHGQVLMLRKLDSVTSPFQNWHAHIFSVTNLFESRFKASVQYLHVLFMLVVK